MDEPSSSHHKHKHKSHKHKRDRGDRSRSPVDDGAHRSHRKDKKHKHEDPQKDKKQRLEDRDEDKKHRREDRRDTGGEERRRDRPPRDDRPRGDDGRRHQDRRGDDRDRRREDRRKEKESRHQRMYMNSGHHPTAEDLAKLPAYYSLGSVNASRFAEAEKKRKLLWSKQPEDEAQTSDTKEAAPEQKPEPPATGAGGEEIASSWKQIFAATGNDAKAEKFKRLCGLKTATSASTSAPAAPTKEPSADEAPTVNSSNSKWFSDMDRQYEVARMSTHMARGAGLGFGHL